ncbi:hypothetical protein RF11_00626 [Thelohanellus kitauei]|uniref:Uncharacterized protein n=1 Tax=Thelohanellus kitauei TaxID=669202 RepID=A0A0C2N880_THEKT|nr:hypothetical protein RF11_00626 [Thelohanellus kitauei]
MGQTYHFNSFIKTSTSSSNINIASLVHSYWILCRGKPYTDGEYVVLLKSIGRAISISKEQSDIQKKSPSLFKTKRDNSENITNQLFEDLKLVYGHIKAVHEFCDINDAATI